ncbi:MAG: class I SAM-dependent methyltransferase, partial [Planctomycetaceae bacterium]
MLIDDNPQLQSRDQRGQQVVIGGGRQRAPGGGGPLGKPGPPAWFRRQLGWQGVGGGPGVAGDLQGERPACRHTLPQTGQHDLSDWTPPAASFDLIFSNAALQWVPRHQVVLRRLWQGVAAGGALALQIPCNPRTP